ncbi:MAG: response regulator, partial [Gammaproteobacteria bacterium]|nr:response regulator [Gammaproteobacteria bacterium]
MGADNNKEQLLRILAVDDSKLMRKAVARILKGVNDVVEAEHGEDAWDMLQQDETIKIVCCDLSMPVMDGFGFLERVRNSDDERIREMPVIIVTGQEDSEENRNKIFEAGASDFVSKPFDSAQLRASIKTHTRLEKTASELRRKTTEYLEKTSEFETLAAVDP